MLEIKKLNSNENIQNISKFIAEINNNQEAHIGYCGIDSKEIAHSLLEDLSDIPFMQSFVVAYQDEGLVGVLGFDADLENHSAEIWGPFIKEKHWDIVDEMWNSMLALLPPDNVTIHMFPNKQNRKARELAKKLGFSLKSEQTTVKATQEESIELQDVALHELTTDTQIAMKIMHDKYFPDTYYNGEQIVNRINEYQKVFILQENDRLLGYIYVEANPEFGEGSIEFFAVDRANRGAGRGRKLLKMALKWLFSFEKIEDITLCVNSENHKALNLYEKVGFKKVHELCFYTLNRK